MAKTKKRKKDKRLCDYCETREATRTMEHTTICRFIKSGRLISKELEQPTKYWCDKCWHQYD